MTFHEGIVCRPLFVDCGIVQARMLVVELRWEPHRACRLYVKARLQLQRLQRGAFGQRLRVAPASGTNNLTEVRLFVERFDGTSVERAATSEAVRSIGV